MKKFIYNYTDIKIKILNDILRGAETRYKKIEKTLTKIKLLPNGYLDFETCRDYIDEKTDLSFDDIRKEIEILHNIIILNIRKIKRYFNGAIKNQKSGLDKYFNILKKYLEFENKLDRHVSLDGEIKL